MDCLTATYPNTAAPGAIPSRPWPFAPFRTRALVVARSLAPVRPTLAAQQFQLYQSRYTIKQSTAGTNCNIRAHAGSGKDTNKLQIGSKQPTHSSELARANPRTRTLTPKKAAVVVLRCNPFRLVTQPTRTHTAGHTPTHTWSPRYQTSFNRQMVPQQTSSAGNASYTPTCLLHTSSLPPSLNPFAPLSA